MNLRTWAVALVSLLSVSAPVVHAQSASVQAADFVVALVNSEPITNSEVRRGVARMTQQLEQTRQTVPPLPELRTMVLEQLIGERAQLQFARETGIRVDESNLDNAQRAVARQQQIDVPELHKRLAKEGISVAMFRSQLRDQILLTRLREREVDSRVRITEVDIDRALREQQAKNNDPLTQEINLAQILISVPEKSSKDVAKQRFEQAKEVLARIRKGERFEALVEEVSAADRTNGGQLGLRRADRYPLSFVQATQLLAVGGVSEIVHSGAGFHILKVVEKRAPALPTKTVVQTLAQHILLRPSTRMPEASAELLLADYKKRIEAGKEDFAAVARKISQDGSASQGGVLGWANPGLFVPEFEEAMNHLAEGQISEPLVSRFGVHLIRVMERRRVDLTPRELREYTRAELRARRLDEEYVAWAQDVRGRAFVEMREAPQ